MTRDEAINGILEDLRKEMTEQAFDVFIDRTMLPDRRWAVVIRFNGGVEEPSLKQRLSVPAPQNLTWEFNE